MGALGLASRGLKVVRPLTEAVQAAQTLAQDGGEIAVLPGGEGASRRLREILGTPPASPNEDALAVLAVTEPGDVDRGVPALAHRRRSGGGALAIIVGPDERRRDLERRVLDGHRIEASNVAHVASLHDARGAEAVVAAGAGPVSGRLAPRRKPGAKAAGRLRTATTEA